MTTMVSIWWVLLASVGSTLALLNSAPVINPTKCIGATPGHGGIVASFVPGRISLAPMSHRQNDSLTRSRLDMSSESPWASGMWEVTLDFDRSAVDSQPTIKNENVAAAASGGRLVLSLEALVTADANDANDANDGSQGNDENWNRQRVQKEWLGGKATGSILPQPSGGHCATYVNEKGEQAVRISPGQWRIEPPPSLPGQASTLKCHLVLQSSLSRNSVSFPRDQLLLLQCNLFRQSQYRAGYEALLPLARDKLRSQRALERQLNHETGDRRLDGTDLFDTMEGYRDVAALVWDRDEANRRYKEVEPVLPIIDQHSIHFDEEQPAADLLPGNSRLNRIMEEEEERWGLWPGDTQLATLERGLIMAVVDKKEDIRPWLPWQNEGAGTDEMVVVGKWSAVPVFEDD